MFPADRGLRDLSLIKTSASYIVPFGYRSSLKSKSLIKTGVFRIGYLPRNGSVGELDCRSWKYSLWPTNLLKKLALDIQRRLAPENFFGRFS
jgi:hypothetical protein